METKPVIPDDLDEQEATVKMQYEILCAEYDGLSKQIAIRNKLLKLMEDRKQRETEKSLVRGLVERQAELVDRIAPLKTKLKELHILQNEARRQEAAKRKEDNRRAEYNRQFTDRMRRMWRQKTRREALERIGRENQEALGETVET